MQIHRDRLFVIACILGNKDVCIVLQFQGCYYHGCDCQKGRMDELLRQTRKTRTDDRACYIRNQGYTIVEMWECQLKKLSYVTPELDDCDIIPPFTRKHPSKVNEAQILKAVKENQLFGAIEVDLKVPKEWGFKVDHNRTPYDHFSEMSPIFCTTDISFDSIGPHMQDHINRYNLSKVSRCSTCISHGIQLITSYTAFNMVILTVSIITCICFSKTHSNYPNIISYF